MSDMDLLMAAAISLLVVLISGPKFIPKLREMKFGQSIREEGPKSHQAKSGTPTMGGVMIVLAITVATIGALSLGQGVTPTVWLALFVMLGHFVIGFIDDYIKVVLKRNLGLRAWQKLLGQMIMAVVVTYISVNVLDNGTRLWLPGINKSVDIENWYYVLSFLLLVGTTNAVNLTDGLDGLAAGTVMVASIAYILISFWAAQEEMAVFSIAVAAACLGFLRFNKHPAQVFMGDTGSLALGGALAALALLTKTELLLIVVGGVFVMEALSVIIQVISFKTTGKRAFLMSPIHHHFELKGWSESKVVLTFWTVGLLLAVLAIRIMVMSPARGLLE